jgi:hypothetical protein
MPIGAPLHAPRGPRGGLLTERESKRVCVRERTKERERERDCYPYRRLPHDTLSPGIFSYVSPPHIAAHTHTHRCVFPDAPPAPAPSRPPQVISQCANPPPPSPSPSLAHWNATTLLASSNALLVHYTVRPRHPLRSLRHSHSRRSQLRARVVGGVGRGIVLGDRLLLECSVAGGGGGGPGGPSPRLFRVNRVPGVPQPRRRGPGTTMRRV